MGRKESNQFIKFLQAFIFWVVDNFLKQRTRNTKTIYVNDNDASVRYSRSEDTAKLYNRIEKVEEGDSDILMSNDDDGDTRHRRTDTERLITWQIWKDLVYNWALGLENLFSGLRATKTHSLISTFNIHLLERIISNLATTKISMF